MGAFLNPQKKLQESTPMTRNCITAPCALKTLFPSGSALALAFFVVALLFGAGQAKANSSDLVPTEELHCLALTLYYEARGEPDLGKVAVGHVVMNRVADERYPDSVCGVVQQGGQEVRYRCQFTWWCDGQSDDPSNKAAWERAQAIARAIYWGYSQDPTEGALSYHADYVNPNWGKSLVRGPQIGQHIFYHPAGGLRRAEGHDTIQPGPQTARR